MADVVRYWRAVELFSPPVLPRASRSDLVYDVQPRAGEAWPLLPWDPGHPLSAEPIDPSREVWRHTVYGGVFELDAVRDALAAALGGDDAEDFAGRNRSGETAVFGLVVAADGTLLKGTTVFSSCAWATGRIRDPGVGTPGWLDGFDEAAAECAAAIEMLTSQEIGYGGGAPSTPVPAGAPGTPPPAVPAARTGSTVPAASSGPGWLQLVGSILGGAAVGALGTLFGDMGFGVVAGAAAPAYREMQRRRAASVPAQASATAVPVGAASGPPVEPAATPMPAADAEPSGAAALRPIVLPDLVAFAAHVAAICGVTDFAAVTRFRIRSEKVRLNKNGIPPDADAPFLNSFLLDDLRHVADAANDGYGPALAGYLTDTGDVAVRDRVDVRADPGLVLAHVAPNLFPKGRWPAEAAHPLAVSQQFALNTMLAGLRDHGGIFSVNGPPGTGKTTLLRDLVAANVVERAEHLAELTSPAAGFSGSESWPGDTGQRKAHRLAEQLCGYEMVVASSNNGAVENITRELPALSAIGWDWIGDDIAYFLDQACALLDGAPAWGLVAAPLGSAKKRKEFAERVLWGVRPKPARTGAGRARRGGDGETRREREPDPAPGLIKLLKAVGERAPLRDPGIPQRYPAHARQTPADAAPPAAGADTATADTDWATAVRRFRTAVAREAELRDERFRISELLRLEPVLPEQVRLTAASVDRAREALDRCDEAVRQGQADAAWYNATTLAAQTRLDEHMARQPGGLSARFGRGQALAAWRDDADRYARDLDAQWQLVRQAEAAHALAVRQRGRAAADLRLMQESAAEAARDAHGVAAALAAARADWPDTLPDGWHTRDDAARETCAPWADQDWNRARTEVFLAAMALHRAFIAANAFKVRTNLLAMADVLGGRSTAPAAAVEAAWRTLFLVVPVVSTTFASCGRLFRQLGRESLGWLLIDEAGQATPQAAVGALWRARRAVVVGDPLQLEPVVALPVHVQALLARADGIAAEWIPSYTSAQRLADRVNRYGTELDDGGAESESGKVWVGAPLRVHRRCQSPMFEVSNDIAYGGMMVSATRHEAFPGPDTDQGWSCWLDVSSAVSRGKWIPDEGDALAYLLDGLHRHRGVALDRIRILSPFRDVVAGCRVKVREVGRTYVPPADTDAASYRKRLDDFVGEHIGTVHTMQGKESDVVILVLGTDPRAGRPARAWAAASPNLLNVAVSRAKRRLYVIGNRTEWARERHFDTLAAEVERRAYP